MGDSEDPSAHLIGCWACSILIQVPKDLEGATAFKCGWCGAITDARHTHQSSSQARLHAAPQQSAGSRLVRCLASTGRWLLVAMVVTIICLIMAIGILVVQPHALGDNAAAWVLHAGLTVLLVINVWFNYAACVLGSPGSVQECVPMPGRHGEGGTYLPGAFDNWALCQPCNGAKPPGVHHCRVCRMCVVDMDHHCPFIKNCVGRANMRPFILFLTWVILSAIYIMGLCSFVLYSNRVGLIRVAAQARLHAAAASQHPGNASSTERFTNTVVAAFMAVSSIPWWLLCTCYLLVLALALLVCMGLLLGSQLRLLALGVSYVDQLQAQRQRQQRQQQQQPQPQYSSQDRAGSVQSGAAGTDMQQGFSFARLLERLSEVFGSHNVAAWLLPRWQSAPGSLASSKKIA